MPEQQFIPLKQVPVMLPVPLTYTSVLRWVKFGVKGRKLACQRIGGRLYTTPSALREFLDARKARHTSSDRLRVAV